MFAHGVMNAFGSQNHEAADIVSIKDIIRPTVKYDDGWDAIRFRKQRCGIDAAGRHLVWR